MTSYVNTPEDDALICCNVNVSFKIFCLENIDEFELKLIRRVNLKLAIKTFKVNFVQVSK